MRRVLITTFGSLGDLHPYLAIGQELVRRGHPVRVATLRVFQERVEAAGLEFAPLRCSVVEEPTPELMRRVLLKSTGVRYIVRDLVAPAIRTAYLDTQAAAEGADLLVSHPLTFATRMVAERRGLPWLSTQLAPAGFMSAYDPPVVPWVAWMRRAGAGARVYRPLLRFGEDQTRRWLRSVDALRTELGLTDRGNPLFAGGHSPFGVLALFSPMLGAPQPDWPAKATVTGFPFYRQELVPDPALEAWLAQGSAPVVFTLGSSAVITPGKFFGESIAAARRLGTRALLVGYAPATPGSPVNLAAEGEHARRGSIAGGDESLFAAPYAAYGHILPQAAAVVHQGGAGTTAEVLRAGKPMLVVPFGVDQPDNAARVERLGVARVLRRTRYRADRVVVALGRVLSPGMRSRAAEIGAAIGREDGAGAAAEVIAQVLGGSY